jgi:hypothetical protein
MLNTTNIICGENNESSSFQVCLYTKKYLVNVDHKSMAVQLNRSDCEGF